MYWTQGLHRALQQHPDAPATVFGGRVRSFADQAGRVSRLASALKRVGVHDGQRVGVLALNSDRFAELMLAVPWANGVFVPLSVRWGPTEISYALADSGAEILVVDDAFVSLVPTITHRCPDVAVVVHAGDGRPADGQLGYEALLAAAEPIDDVRRGGEELAALVYTGGTTGLAKGVMISHAALLGSALALEATPTGFGATRTLIATPMSHMSGLFSSLLQTTYGGSQVIVPAFEPAAVLHAIQRHRAGTVFLVPSMVRALLAHPAAAETDLSSIENVSYGASPIDVELLERAMKAFPNAGFRQVYSSTELACSGTYLTPRDHAEGTRLASAGRAAANIELRIVDRDGIACPPGALGEIVARGQLMTGYWRRPEETAATIRDGWLHTGDAGFLDDAGYLHVVDRLKDMVITGSANVYSTEVENALVDHPAVATCAVIGVPDDALGERVHAVIVLADGAATDLDDLQYHCRRTITEYKIPRSYEIVDALPVSPVGKPLKRELRKRHWAGLDRQVH